MTIKENNRLYLELISYFLNNNEKSIKKDDVKEVMECGVDEELAYSLLLSSFLNIDSNKELLNNYIKRSIKLLDSNDYKNNEYYKNIKVDNIKYKKWELKNKSYNPYELFVYDDFLYDNEYVIPRLGFFNKRYHYLSVYNNNRLWMSITPNEINTMKEPVELANGNVLVIGLGLGYYQYMISLKENVQSITIVELDKDVIDLFKKIILPRFEFKDKIKIINDDGIEYLKKINDNDYDFIFIDIYHDVSDGLPIYKEILPYFKNFKNTKYHFWIEKTIKYYF